jgi:DNA ligase (NAD+)
VASVLARRFGSVQALAAASVDDISEIDGIGPEIAGSVDDWFSDVDNLHLIERLGAAGVSLEDVVEARAVLPQTLEGLTVVITGTLEGFTRDSATAAVVDRGGKVSGSVSSRTSALVAGENAGSKLSKAESLGVPVLGEDAFVDFLERGVDAID